MKVRVSGAKRQPVEAVKPVEKPVTPKKKSKGSDKA